MLRALRDAARARGDQLARNAADLDREATALLAEMGGREMQHVMRLRLAAETRRLAAAMLGHHPLPAGNPENRWTSP